VDSDQTFLCTCLSQWKGLRCEYAATICTQKMCNESHVCVGLALADSSVCLNQDEFVVHLIYNRLSGVNIQTFQARLVNFIVKNGRLPSLPSSNARKKREAPPLEVQVFVVDAADANNKYTFDIVVLKNSDEVFPKEAVLKILTITCRDISMLH